jgi:shikimate dehydrogenase
VATARPDRYAVAGHPIAHSRSPFIHALFAQQTGENVVYDALDIEADEFSDRVDAFRRGGGRGLNVTVPLKELAFRFSDSTSERAARAGAVNTLCFEADGTVSGDNTDGVGLITDLTVNLGIEIGALHVLLLGAGGAARGVLGPLLDRGPASLVVANRSPQRAQSLVRMFARSEGADVSPCACALDEIPVRPFDLVVNATAASLEGAALALSAAQLARGACCYDMMYAGEPTAFLHLAKSLGAARCADGRGMLVEQAAESFRVWRGVRPRTAPVIEALGRTLEGR